MFACFTLWWSWSFSLKRRQIAWVHDGLPNYFELAGLALLGYVNVQEILVDVSWLLNCKRKVFICLLLDNKSEEHLGIVSLANQRPHYVAEWQILPDHTLFNTATTTRLGIALLTCFQGYGSQEKLGNNIYQFFKIFLYGIGQVLNFCGF